MGKRMKQPFLFKTTQPPPSPSWPWPTCKSPETLSFRAAKDAGISPENTSSASVTGEVETVLRGLRSDRFFFEPGGETRSIMEEKRTSKEKDQEGFLYNESMVMSMESIDPYLDFKKSMQEMVEAFGLKKIEGFQKLLNLYLKANSKVNHGYIIGAFLDLLVDFLDQEKFEDDDDDDDDDDKDSLYTTTSCSNNSTNYSTNSFSYSTSSIPCLSSLESEKSSLEKYSCSSSYDV